MIFLYWLYQAIRTTLKTRSLHLGWQVYHMRLWHHCNLHLAPVAQNKLQWRLAVNPDGKQAYDIILNYVDNVPRLYVIEPVLREDAPYRLRDGALGLFHPEDGFLPHLPLAKTMIPWACTWLYTYRIWDITGEWVYTGSAETGEELR